MSPSATDRDASEEEAINRSKADVGVIAALSLEIDPFVARCDRVKKYTGGEFTFRGGFLRDARVAIVEGGAGVGKATRAAHALIDAHTPQWMISTGFAGGLTEALKVGDIIVANEVVPADGSNAGLQINLKMKPDPAKGLHVGRVVQSPEIIRTTAERAELHGRTGAIAVDQESLAVAEVCRDRKVKFLSVRAICDDTRVDLPPEVLSIFGRTGSVRAGAVLGALWKRPSSYKDLWRLRQDAHLAADRLAMFLSSMIRQIMDS